MGKFDYSINFEKSLTEFGSSHNRWVGNWNAQRAFFLFKEHSELLDYSAHNFYADMDILHMYLVTTTPTTEMAKLINSSGLCSKGAWVPQVTNICLSATRLTYVFCISFCWATMDLKVNYLQDQNNNKKHG